MAISSPCFPRAPEVPRSSSKGWGRGGGQAVRRTYSTTLTIKLQVVVHDEAAGESKCDVVIVLEGYQKRVVQVLRRRAAMDEAEPERQTCQASFTT